MAAARLKHRGNHRATHHRGGMAGKGGIPPDTQGRGPAQYGID